MKYAKFLVCAFMFFLMASTSHAIPVTCTNCSTMLVQMLERVTNMEQLRQLVKEYNEMIQQTAAQLEMVQQNIQQYANMVKNTVTLPASMIQKISGELSKMARITNAINSIRSDIAGLGQIYDALYENQEALDELAALPQELLSQGNMTYRSSWDSWSQRVDESTKATFQLSGHQLKDLEESGELESYINQLLSTPDGQQKAIMAGNQLAALQIQEARQLRELIATKVQSDLASQSKAEKESQMNQMLHRRMMDGFESVGTGSKPDPF